MSFMFGLLIGLIVGFMVGVWAVAAQLRDSVKNGGLEIKGKLYRITLWDEQAKG